MMPNDGDHFFFRSDWYQRVEMTEQSSFVFDRFYSDEGMLDSKVGIKKLGCISELFCDVQVYGESTWENVE